MIKLSFNKLTSSFLQTQKLGEFCAKQILKGGSLKRAVVLSLKGDLGGGKTTFLQGFAKGLGIREKILSPTFIIMRKFKIKNSKLFTDFYHIDCYRIKDSKDLLALGFKKIVSCPDNIVAIEWADRVKKIIPSDAFWIKFDFKNKNSRRIFSNAKKHKKQ